MKRNIILSLLFLYNLPIFSFEINRAYNGQFIGENFNYPSILRIDENSYFLDFDYAKNIELFDIPPEKIKDTKFAKDYYEEKGEFTINSENGLSVIKFKGSDSFQLLTEAGLLHYGELLYLVKGNKIIYDSFFFPKEPAISTFAEILQIEVSSYLTEKEIKYDGQNFNHYKHDLLPWVENKPDEGIGEWIEFKINNEPHYFPSTHLDTLLISNGYVNFEKPYLYSANNRVKKIQIYCPENGMDFEANIDDDSQFQTITFPEPLPQKKCTIRITIKDVYKGTKWNDTCINRILIANSVFLETGKIR